MLVAGEVGAVFAIENRASATLKQLMDEFEALQVQIDRTQEAMRVMAFPARLTEGVAALQTKMTQVAEASKAVGDEAAPVLEGALAVPSWRGDAVAVPDGQS